MKLLNLFFLVVIFLSGCRSQTIPIYDGTPLIDIERTTNLSAEIKSIGGLPRSVRVEDVSRNGIVAIGRFRSNLSPYEWRVFEYKYGQGIRNLGAVVHGYIPHGTIDQLRLNGDGSLIWGTFNVNEDGYHLFQQPRSGKLLDLGTLGKKSLRVNGVSNDGSIIVGDFWNSSNEYNKPFHHAFRFSLSNGFEDLGVLGEESAFARGVSPNGEVIVGNTQLADTTAHAFIHSPTNGTKDLGNIGGVAAFATDVTDDGSLAVGEYYGTFSIFRYTYDSHIFLYTRGGKIQTLKAMGGRTAGNPRLSLDGRKIVGSYIDSDETFLYIGNIRLP